MGTPKRKLFLTYARLDDAEGDFSWLVQRIERAGLDVLFDDRVVVPGRRLWPQIEAAIVDEGTDAWGWLLTPNSVSREACREELEYARLRTLNARGEGFPLIGLVDRVPAEQLPLAIRSRLYVDLKAPQWVDRVVAGVEGRIPCLPQQHLENYHWTVHRNYEDDPEAIAVEVRPRFGSIPYFAILAPMPGPELVGTGAAGGGSVSGVAPDSNEWEDVEIFGEKAKIDAMRGPVDPAMSAYAIFRGRIPSWVAFGPCQGPRVLPPRVERLAL